MSLPDSLGRAGLEIHPLVLNGCFQVTGAARAPDGDDQGCASDRQGMRGAFLDANLPDASYPSQPRTVTQETTFGNLARL